MTDRPAVPALAVRSLSKRYSGGKIALAGVDVEVAPGRLVGLLAIATRGVVFAPGSAGTTQEVFQDATQNHYDVFGVVSPMVFLDEKFWTDTLPAEPLLRKLAGDRPYGRMIGAAETADAALQFLLDHPPVVAPTD